ncbi:MAG TPA: hypothetical protein VN540_06865 [Clostridia bacterium]|nr:hypothetical protein [Clostridia bacterium]
MTDVLGFELHRATELLAREGYAVSCAQISSKKGVPGNEARVVRVRRTGDFCVELTWAVFKTDVDYIPEGTDHTG